MSADEIPSDAKWIRASSVGNHDQHVEVAHLLNGNVGLRNSRYLGQPPLVFTGPEWDAFLNGVRNSEFARPAAVYNDRPYNRTGKEETKPLKPYPTEALADSPIRKESPMMGALARDLPNARWRNPYDSSGPSAVELAQLDGGGMALRGSNDPDGLALIFTRAEWIAFTDAVRAGNCDPV